MNASKHGVTGMALSTEEVKAFKDYLVDAVPSKAKVNKKGKEQEDTNIRDADVYFVEHEAKELYEIFQKIAQMVNLYFKYELTGIEKAQIMHYKAPSNGYEYHIDIDANNSESSRKVSVSILLNEDYKGGEMCFRTGEEPSCTKPKTGNVVAFSSFIPHKINPITSGERYAVVVWFTGPCFR